MESVGLLYLFLFCTLVINKDELVYSENCLRMASLQNAINIYICIIINIICIIKQLLDSAFA